MHTLYGLVLDSMRLCSGVCVYTLYYNNNNKDLIDWRRPTDWLRPAKNSGDISKEYQAMIGQAGKNNANMYLLERRIRRVSIL